MVGTNKTQSLTVTDNRTGATIQVPITNNSVNALDFKKLAAPFAKGERKENDTEGGLRILDVGEFDCNLLG